MFIPQDLPILTWRTSLAPTTYELDFVEDLSGEGLAQYVSLQRFVTYVLLLITLIEILFSRPIICRKYLYYFPWAYLLCMLMDYVSLYANSLYNFHMLAYLGCLGHIAGINL
jgi:hypothetical protein